MVITHNPAARPDPVAAWPLVLRVAGVAAVLTTTVVWALARFTAVGQGVLLGGAVLAALAVGSRLPAAAPWFLRPIPLEHDDRSEAD